MMGDPSSDSQFFQAGGTLHPGSPSYVTRAADAELWQALLAGEYCNVLAARQLGKSSLKTRTVHHLRDQGIRTVTIDLTKGGSEVSGVGPAEWYFGLITEFTRQLKLSVDEASWWHNHHQLSPVKRFSDFLRQVVLEEVTDPVVVFIDEIDSTLNLPFTDDFFAAIRAAYNARADDPAYKRLTFVLIGVASPAELIEDRTHTPYNIGTSIDLRDFTAQEAHVLLQGLEAVYPAQAALILDRILHWTDGHPYLTQRLCLDVADAEEEVWTAPHVDDLVARTFLSEAAHNESNLKFVRDTILTHHLQDQLLKLYNKVLRGRTVRDDGQSQVHNQLKLSGLVKAQDGHLRVRNHIYRRVFNRAWVTRNTAINWWRIAAGIAASVAMFALAFVLYNFALLPDRFRDCENAFFKAQSSEERLAHLAKAFGQRGFLVATDYDLKARDLFYALPREEQLNLFDANGEDSDLVTLVKGLYVTFADVDETGATTPILEKMARALERMGETEEASRLKEEILAWLRARQLVTDSQYIDALAQYDRSVELNPQNPATLYERARTLIQQSAYQQALSDLDQVLAIAARAPSPTATPPPQSPSAPIATSTSTPTSTRPATDMTPTNTKTSPISVTPGIPLLLTPTLAPTPAPTPLPARITSGFANRGQMISTVRNLIRANSGLIDTLLRASISEYPNLREFGLAPESSATVYSFAIDGPQQLGPQQEYPSVHGSLEYADQVNPSELRVLVYVAGLTPDSEQRWVRGEALCEGEVGATGWELAPGCTIFPTEYSSFAVVAVLVREDTAASLPVELVSPDADELTSELAVYAYPLCNDLTWCRSVSPMYMVQRTAEPIQTPTPTFTPIAPIPTLTPTSTPTAIPYVTRLDLVAHGTTSLPTLLPGAVFTASWGLRSRSPGRWPEGVKVVFLGGDRMGGPDEQPVEPPLSSTETFTVTVPLIAPASDGLYEGVWQLQDTDGNPLSDELSVTVAVFVPPTPPPSYRPPELAGIDIIACNVTLKWGWPAELAQDEWFDVRVGKLKDGLPYGIAWTKEQTFIYTLKDAGEYVWEIAVCRGDPAEADCSGNRQLTVSYQATFAFGGCD